MFWREFATHPTDRPFIGAAWYPGEEYPERVELLNGPTTADGLIACLNSQNYVKASIFTCWSNL